MKKIGVNLELLQKTLKKGTAFALAGSIVLGGQAVIPKDNSFGVQTVCAAEQNVVNLDVQMGVNLYMNDKGFVPTDVNGNETYPFIYEGTTYVPVRAIAQLFNATINWDEQTKTVIIATTGESAKLKHTYRPKQELYNKTITAETGARLVVNGQECIPTDVNGNVKDIYIVNGTTYVPVRAVSEALDLPITWSDKSNSVFIGLHKTTGLTVENINDLDAVKEAQERFFGSVRPWAWTYTYNNQTYDLVSNDYQEFYMAIILMNLDYCSDDLLIKVFPNLDDFTINRLINFTLNIGYDFVLENNCYNFTYCSVDMINGEFVDKLQNMCSEKYRQEHPEDGARLVYEYLSDTNPEYDRYKDNMYINYLVSAASRHTFLSKDTQYFELIRDLFQNQDLKKYKTWRYRVYHQQLLEKFTKKYNQALEKSKQKQLLP